jgi:hypothetical protein
MRLLPAARIIILGAIFLGIQFDAGCKKAEDYEPPEDTLIAAPAPPNLSYPEHEFVFMPELYPFYIQLEWDSVAGAEIYERELICGTSPPTYIITTETYYVLAIGIALGTGEYYWRIRASSSAWQGGYTDWSGQRNVEVRTKPSPPNLRSPPDSSVIYFDSLPPAIDCIWQRRSDEEYYEFQYYRDSILIEHVMITDTTYAIPIDEAGEYSWRVRAGSAHWQSQTDWSDRWCFRIILNRLRR